MLSAGLQKKSKTENRVWINPLEGSTEDWDEKVGTDADPLEPTYARPGSDEKVAVLAARYATGLPLWNQDDCFDHANENQDTEAVGVLTKFNLGDVLGNEKGDVENSADLN